MCFSRVPHQGLATEGRWWFLDTFRSSRMPERVRGPGHGRPLFVYTGGPGVRRFSFIRTVLGYTRIPTSARAFPNVGRGAEGVSSEFAVASHSPWRSVPGGPRLPCTSVFAAVGICAVAFSCALLHRGGEEWKMPLQVLRNVGLTSSGCFGADGQGEPGQSIKGSLD